VGKTRLAQEAVALARAAGMSGAWGRVGEADGSPPYWPFRRILRSLDSEMPALPEPPAGSRPDTAAQERFRLFESVADALRAAAAPSGLVIVLDDIQWSDAGSLQLLVHLAGVIADARLAVVVTYRDTETAGRDALLAALGALIREPAVTRLRVTGLTESEVGEQLAAITGWPVPVGVASAVCERTRGNPFFVEELGRVLADSSGGTLPDGVRDAVRDRLRRLSEVCRSVVSAAAVLGSEVDAPALNAVTGRGWDEVLLALDEAAAAGIVTSDHVARFSHDLIQEAARLEVPRPERLALHKAMAEYLATRADAPSRIAEVAHHWLESLPVGDAGRAIAAAETAALQAMQQLAWEEASGLYDRAITAAGAAQLDPADRGRLLLGAAQAKVRSYDMEGARQAVLAAAEVARAIGDAELIGRAVLTMEGVTDFIWDSTGRALCEEALAGIIAGDSALRARLLAQLVVDNIWQPRELSKERAAEALAMAERVGDRRAIAEALRASQVAHSSPHGAQDRLGFGNRLLAIAASGNHDDAVLWGHLWRFDALCQLGDVAAAEGEMPAVAAAARRLRSPLAQWHEVRCRGTIAVARGRFAEGLQYGEEAVALARRAGHEGSLLPSLGFLVVVRGQLGQVDPLPDELLAMHLHHVATASMRAVQARWRLQIGDRDEAMALYRNLPGPDQIPPFVILPALAGFAELAHEFDDKPTAANVYRLLSPHSDKFVCGGAGVILIEGSVHLALGLAAGTMGRVDDAVRHLRTAVDINERAGLPAWTAMARYHLARTLARRKRTGDELEASALAALAIATAERLGLAPLHTVATALASTLAGTSAGLLSPRERQVAELVAQGLTNKQIAAAERISERTVETHVRNIMSKLGFTTRSQIAAWFASGHR
jgi:DNA-binding CsgD family transcriptional regulator